jgi:hypothetical protein
MTPVKFLSIAAPLLGPFVAPLNAQTPQANIAGSWAFWLEAGQGANAAFGLGATHPDVIPDQQLNVFHSHFAPGGIHCNATNTPSEDLRLAALAAILKMAGMWAAWC